MPLALPHLDDRTWEDLVDESRRRLPVYAPAWTNHNPSDPGITLLELFAYYCESFLYRIDQVGRANRQAFFKLLNGPDWQPGNDLAYEIRNTVRDLTRPHRAVTPEDFEFLATAANEQFAADAPAQVGRAKCLPRINLEGQASRSPASDAPGHVSVVIVPNPSTADIGPLLHHVRRVLEPARLVGTQVHVVPAAYVSLGVRISAIIDRRMSAKVVRNSVLEILRKFFDPLHGGPDNLGWPFGRSIYVSEIYQLLIRVPAIKSLGRTLAPESGTPPEELILRLPDTARMRRNRLGELEAIELRPHELVIFEPRDDEITVTYDPRPSDAGGREAPPSIS